MEDNTLAVILSRFDKLDTKNDEALRAIAALASRVTAVETKLETQLSPVVAEQTFRRRAAYFGHIISLAISTAITLAIRALWPSPGGPPSILHK
jgi:hypothetical protein